MTSHEKRALRRLLVAAVVAADHPTEPGAIEHLARAAPIRVLPEAAAIHRVSGVVLRGLEDVDRVPEDVRTTLAQDRSASALRHLLVVGALSEITRAFDERALDWVAMKGPVVAELLYRDAGDRTYADLDVLVVPDQFPAAMEALENLGYVPAIKDWALAERMLAGQVNMTGPTVQIDLHWALHYSDQDRRPFHIAPGDMVRRSRHVDVAGLDVPTFDPADTLLSLAFHAARSGGHRLLWLKDLERSVTVDRPDLDEVVRRAQRSRCGPPIGVMLARAAAVLGADVPDDVVRALVPRSLGLANRLLERAVPPVQLHDRDTVTRWFTRSARASVASTTSDVPRRAMHRLVRTTRPPRPNETDDLTEKARYLDAVSRSATPVA